MTENKKKKLGLQKNVSSIFKGVPIPQKNAGEDARQTPNAPASRRSRNFPMMERTIGSSSESQRRGDIPTPEHTIDSSPESQRKGDIPIPERTVDVSESKRTIDTPEPERTGNIPAKPKFQETQKPQISLFKKINQPTQLLRKDTPVKQLVVDANKKATKPGQWQRARDKLFAPKAGTNSARHKATAALIPVLAFVFIFVLRQVFWTAPHRTEGAVEDNKSGAATTISTSNEIDWQIPALFPPSLRDPLKTITSGNEQGDAGELGEIVELNINGILYSKDNPSVLIGDRIVHEGEQISGVTIVKIYKNSVEFEMNGTKWERSVRRQTEDPNREVTTR